MSNKVGEVLKAARLKKNLTQSQFGAMIGWRASFVTNIEQGKKPLPAAAILPTAEALNIPVKKLIGAYLDDVETHLYHVMKAGA